MKYWMPLILAVTLAGCQKSGSGSSANHPPAPAPEKADRLKSLDGELSAFAADLEAYRRCLKTNGEAGCLSLSDKLNSYQFEMVP